MDEGQRLPESAAADSSEANLASFPRRFPRTYVVGGWQFLLGALKGRGCTLEARKGDQFSPSPPIAQRVNEMPREAQ